MSRRCYLAEYRGYKYEPLYEDKFVVEQGRLLKELVGPFPWEVVGHWASNSDLRNATIHWLRMNGINVSWK